MLWRIRSACLCGPSAESYRETISYRRLHIKAYTLCDVSHQNSHTLAMSSEPPTSALSTPGDDPADEENGTVRVQLQDELREGVTRRLRQYLQSFLLAGSLLTDANRRSHRRPHCEAPLLCQALCEHHRSPVRGRSRRLAGRRRIQELQQGAGREQGPARAARAPESGRGRATIRARDVRGHRKREA